MPITIRDIGSCSMHLNCIFYKYAFQVQQGEELLVDNNMVWDNCRQGTCKAPFAYNVSAADCPYQKPVFLIKIGCQTIIMSLCTKTHIVHIQQLILLASPHFAGIKDLRKRFCLLLILAPGIYLWWVILYNHFLSYHFTAIKRSVSFLVYIKRYIQCVHNPSKFLLIASYVIWYVAHIDRFYVQVWGGRAIVSFLTL